MVKPKKDPTDAADAALPSGGEFYPAPESVTAEARYLLAYRTGGQSFDRQKTLHAALNVAGWLNAGIPAAEAAQAPKRGGPHEEETPDLDESLKALAHPAPDGTQAGLFGGGGQWGALLKRILTEIVLKLLAG